MTDVDEELSAKKLRKLEKNSDTRPLDPWERYRAMIDLYEAFFDMNELADRKTRFALVMMGALNALNLILGSQRMFGDLTAGRAAVGRRLFHDLRGPLAVLLHPGDHHAAAAHLDVSAGRRSAGHRASGIAVHRGRGRAGSDDYYQRWTKVEVGELCRETAQHVQVVARVTDAKFKSLERVYNGLTAMTSLSAVMITVVAYLRIMG